MIQRITTPQLVEVTPENRADICDAYSLDFKDVASKASFAWHFDKRLFYSISENCFYWRET